MTILPSRIGTAAKQLGPRLFSHTWSALSEIHKRKSLIRNDIGVYTSSDS